ncbi:MAG: DUF485 domain-containing protein [Xanthobacteraceae bacterium]
MRTNAAIIEAIRQDPHFQALVRRRTRFALALTAATLIIYFGYIAIVAFAPQWLGVSIGEGMTLGIPLGLLVILAAFALTALYVHRANTEYDALTRQILEDIK